MKSGNVVFGILCAIAAMVSIPGCGTSSIGAWSVTVTGVAASQGSYENKIVVSWDAVEGASSYNIYVVPVSVNGPSDSPATGPYDEIVWGASGTSVELPISEFYGSLYYDYYGDLHAGVHYLFKVEAEKNTSNGYAYSIMPADGAEGWSDPVAASLVGNFASEWKVYSSAGAVTSGTKLAVSVTSGTIGITEATWSAGSWHVNSGARFSYSQALFNAEAGNYGENLDIHDLVQTDYYSGGNFIATSTPTYQKENGANVTAMEFRYDQIRERYWLDLGNLDYFDGTSTQSLSETVYR